MQQGKPFLDSIGGIGQNTQSIVTALQNMVQAINALSKQVQTSASSAANPSAAQ